jgi:hypothetical protein
MLSLVEMLNEHFKTFYEAFQVKFYIKSKLTKCKIIYTYSIYFGNLLLYIVKSTNLSTILQFCTKNMKKIKI